MKKFLIILLMLTTTEALAQSKAEFNSLKEDISVLQRQLYQINNGGGQDQKAATGEFDEEFRDLVGRTDKLEYNLKKLEEKLDMINKDIDIRIKLIEGKDIPQAPAKSVAKKEAFVAPVAKNAPKAVTGENISSQELGSIISNDVKTLYAQGKKALADKNYALAEQKLTMIVEKHPKDTLAGNAQYWLGEVYYVSKDYKKAAVAFGKGYTVYKDSNKGADSLLKLGMSMHALDKNTDACAAFKSMEQQFPKADSAILKKAQEEAKKLECK